MKALFVRILCAILLINTLPAAAQAAIATTGQALHQDARSEVLHMMKREDVRAEFARYGIAPAEMEQKLAAMSDSEIQQLHAQLESLPAGQGAVGTIVGAGVLVFAVLLVTDLLGLTHAFDFVNR